MKKFLFSLFLSLFFLNAFSAHIKGGFFTYEYLGAGLNDPSYLRYKITLTVYMSCFPSTGQLDQSVPFTIFQGSSSIQYANPMVLLTSRRELNKTEDDPCITGNQAVCYYTIVNYELNDYELPVTPDGFTISFQRCCRIADMENLQGSGNIGNTWSIKIPGTASPVTDAVKNSSPTFDLNDTEVVCGGSFFNFPFSAVDKDGDQLTYSLCAAYDGGSVAVAAPNPATPPPYTAVNYASPYSGAQPLGNSVTIDPSTGLITGMAPVVPLFSNGEFVVTVCVTESRDGKIIGETRKELHIQVKDCVPEKAQLAPKGVTCDGFSVDFSNATTLDPSTVYSWNFGDIESGINNTSSQPTPSHTYSDTGSYKVVLEVTLGGFCKSKDSLTVKVYPGFFPSFNPIAPLCKGQPVQFDDNTTSQYGIPTGWRWDFGNTVINNDTSRTANPSYTYPDAGTYDVRLIVSNTFGCTDSITRQVVIADNPLLTLLSKDTSYCGLDTLQLSATGPGNFSWTGGSILAAGTATPLVFPAVPTLYRVTLNQAGCISRDSVRVTPTNDLATSITASSDAICEDDTLTLTANSNYSSNLSYTWTPAAAVSDATGKFTSAFPAANTNFTLMTKRGKNCIATATQQINVRALAKPNAGPDSYVCVGQTTTQLNATGGNTYQWLPATGLSNPNIPNPVASPSATTIYTVMVGISGCTKTKADSIEVLVRELPPLVITNDTLICTIDTLQLTASGNGNFTWLPNVNINNLSVANPLVSPDAPLKYYATLTDPFGCKNVDSVSVDVKAFVTLDAGNDTTICRTDAIILNTSSDALHYKWVPDLYLNSDTDKRPVATPAEGEITYTVFGNIGKCQSEDQVTIRTVPYPQVTISADTLVCFGDSAPLKAAGGSIYTWSPATFLSNGGIANPTSVRPNTDTKYTVTVRDVLGCPKPVEASVWVRVYPIVLANAGPSDTMVVLGQPLVLNGTGGDNYVWTPDTWLNNAGIATPLASPLDDILYRLQVTNVAGCSGTDSIFVKVFKVPPSFYVPTGFSPNGDSRNDIIKPVMLGMRSLKYFRVFNRWGHALFTTSQIGSGWDGAYNGNPQDPGTYVWMAEGETFTGQVIKQQGTVILLR